MLSESLVNMYNNTALILALLLTITVPGAIDVDPHNDSIWTEQHVETGKAIAGLVFFLTSVLAVFGIQFCIKFLSQLSQIPKDKTTEYLTAVGAKWAGIKLLLEDVVVIGFVLGILLQLSVSQPLWVFLPGTVAAIALYLWTNHYARQALIRPKDAIFVREIQNLAVSVNRA